MWMQYCWRVLFTGLVPFVAKRLKKYLRHTQFCSVYHLEDCKMFKAAMISLCELSIMMILYWVSLSRTQLCFLKVKLCFSAHEEATLITKIYSESDVRLHTVSVHQTGSQTFKEIKSLLFPVSKDQSQLLLTRNLWTELSYRASQPLHISKQISSNSSQW